jgi:signal transduction histidine kinase
MGEGFEAAAWRVLATFRVLALAYAVVLFFVGRGDFRHPDLAWLLLLAMTGWTAVVSWAYRSPQRRTWAWAGPDLAVAFVAIVASRFLDSPAHIAAGSPTLPVVWSSAPVLAAALLGGWITGVSAALVVGIADVIHRQGVSTTTVTNLVLLLLAGALIGYVGPLARRGERAIAEAEGLAAATRERERLSHDIHDGVLQVLALINRRGNEIGGPAIELAQLAGEQEQAVRALVSTEAVTRVSGEADLRALLTAYERAGTTVSAPAGPVPLPAAVATDLAAAVGEALANVTRHAGSHARSWVLVDDDGREVVVVVRDDGEGFADGRLAQARDEGRLGVAGSILGRVTALGGSARIHSEPGQGTEVELRVAR